MRRLRSCYNFARIYIHFHLHDTGAGPGVLFFFVTTATDTYIHVNGVGLDPKAPRQKNRQYLQFTGSKSGGSPRLRYLYSKRRQLLH